MSTHATANDAMQARDQSSRTPTTGTPVSTDKGKAIDELPSKPHGSLASMPAETILNISSHLHFPDRRSLLNICRVLRDNKMAWKEALMALEQEVSKATKDHPMLGESPRSYLEKRGLSAIGYSLADLRGLRDAAAFCYGCLRYKSVERFAVNGRFQEMNAPTFYYDSFLYSFSDVSNNGSRRCMDCLASEGLPNPEEPWLVSMKSYLVVYWRISSKTRGHCKKCSGIFELNTLPESPRQRRATLCNDCWKANSEQKQWRATMAQLEELKKPLEVYLQRMRDQDRNTGTDYQDRDAQIEPRGIEHQLIERGLTELPRWTQISELYGNSESEDTYGTDF